MSKNAAPPSHKYYRPLAVACLAAWIIFALVGCKHQPTAEEQKAIDQALADVDSAARNQRPEPGAPSRRAQDIALCAALVDLDTQDDLRRIDSLVTQAGADVNCWCEVDHTTAAHPLLNKIPIVKEYVDDYRDFTSNEDILALALASENRGLLPLLVDKGLAINGEKGHMPALQWAMATDDLALARRLMDLSADAKAVNLGAVCSQKMAALLLDAGAAPASLGLQCALRTRDRKLANYILTQNPKPAGKLDATQLDLRSEEDMEFVHFLLDLDDQATYTLAWDANSFVEAAVQARDCKLLQRLQPHGLDLETETHAMTPLRKSIWDKSADMVACLLDLGAKPQTADFNAMEEAIRLEELDIVQLLRKRNIKVRDGDNQAFARGSGAEPAILDALK